MNKSVKFLTVAAVAFGIGLGVNNFAMSEIPGSYRVAVVDVQQVVAASSQVNELRKECISLSLDGSDDSQFEYYNSNMENENIEEILNEIIYLII